MTRRYSGPVFLSIGFRPFFIGSGVWAVLSMLAWIAALSGYIALPGHITPAQWHFNELLFGVIGAAMIGFLLTAIPNWTGGLPLRGAPLLFSFGLWCAGRVAGMFGGYLGGPAAALIDCAFFVALFVLILREVLNGKNWRNMPVAVAVGLFGFAHIVFYLEALKVVDLGGAGQRLGLGVIAFMLTLIGGRVVPSFTANWLRQRSGKDGPAKGVAAVMGQIDKAVMLLTITGLLAWIFTPDHTATGILLVIAGPANLLRLARWRGNLTFPEPLLFVLHVGYAWLAVSFTMLGAAVLSESLTQGDALHALTAGAAGTMILAVMSRAILGHTGNALHADRVTVLAYCGVSIAALARLAVIVLPDWGVQFYALSGGAWIIAFALFVMRYGPIALRG